MLVSEGNFHGQPVAIALDALAMAVSELASIAERRVERLVNPNLSDGLPAFLTTRRRAQLRVHDPAVRRRVARQREQGRCRHPAIGRLDPDERGAGGSCVDGQHGGATPIAPDFSRRGVEVLNAPGKVNAKDTVSFQLSKLDLTSLGTPKSTAVTVEFTDGKGKRTVVDTVGVTNS